MARLSFKEQLGVKGCLVGLSACVIRDQRTRQTAPRLPAHGCPHPDHRAHTRLLAVSRLYHSGAVN